MSDYQFRAEYGRQQSDYQYQNIITVCETVKGRYGHRLRMAKQVSPDPEQCQSYDDAKTVNLIPVHCEDLTSLYRIVRATMGNKHQCLVRGVPIDPSRCQHVRRLIKPDGNYLPTLVEQPQNWYGIDADKYGVATGDIRKDAKTVLLGLPEEFHYLECVALASANYGIKPGIRMRLFFWNRDQITAYDLKNYFSRHKHVVDHMMFNPNQPIYVATPDFVGMDDPISERLVWLDGESIASDIKHVEVGYLGGESEDWIDKRQAEQKLHWIMQDLVDVSLGKGRNWELFYQSRRAGKLVTQGHFTEDFVFDLLDMACNYWPDRTPKKDHDTIRRGLHAGYQDMGF